MPTAHRLLRRLAEGARAETPTTTRSRCSGSCSCGTWSWTSRSAGTCGKGPRACSSLRRDWNPPRSGAGSTCPPWQEPTDGRACRAGDRGNARHRPGLRGGAGPGRLGPRPLRRSAETDAAEGLGALRTAAAGGAGPLHPGRHRRGRRPERDPRRGHEAIRPARPPREQRRGGAPERRDILEASPESFDRLIRTTSAGPYFLTQAAAR